jgi:hypothetical protein
VLMSLMSCLSLARDVSSSLFVDCVGQLIDWDGTTVTKAYDTAVDTADAGDRPGPKGPPCPSA